MCVLLVYYFHFLGSWFLILIWAIIIKSFHSLWSMGHPWRASRHCGLQLSPWPRSMIVFHFIPKRSPLISGRLLFISVSLIIVFKVGSLFAYSTQSQWWGCHPSLWAGWFSFRVSSPSLWRSPFSTRQWCWFWSTLVILFPQYPPFLASLPLSTTWEGARWETSNSTRADMGSTAINT